MGAGVNETTAGAQKENSHTKKTLHHQKRGCWCAVALSEVGQLADGVERGWLGGGGGWGGRERKKLARRLGGRAAPHGPPLSVASAPRAATIQPPSVPALPVFDFSASFQTAPSRKLDPGRPSTGQTGQRLPKRTMGAASPFPVPHPPPPFALTRPVHAVKPDHMVPPLRRVAVRGDGASGRQRRAVRRARPPRAGRRDDGGHDGGPDDVEAEDGHD